MKTEATIRNKEISLTCPKRAFIQSEIPGGVQKYRNLSRIFMDVMNAIPLNAARIRLRTKSIWRLRWLRLLSFHLRNGRKNGKCLTLLCGICTGKAAR